MKSVNNPILFLPGFGFKATIWQAGLDVSLNAIFQNLPDGKTLQEITDNTVKHIKDPVTLVAWSLGGLVAMDLAHRYPDKIKKLILVATTPQFSATDNWPGISSKVQKQFLHIAENHMDQLLNRFFNLVQTPHQDPLLTTILKMHQQTDKDYLSRQLTVLFNTDLREHFQTLSMPILQIWGEQDGIVSLKLQDHIKMLNPHVKHIIIKNAGHIPFLTHPQEWMALFNAV